MTAWNRKFEKERYEYKLDKSSVVLDLGSFDGGFIDGIYNRYKSYIYGFEPVKSFYTTLANKYKTLNKIKMYNIGLAGTTSVETIYVSADSSSTHKKVSNQQEQVQLIDIREFLQDNEITSISIIKMNIEGGEYPLLDRMIQTDIVSKCDNIQIQFHLNEIDDIKKMQNIRKCLKKTHYLTFQYEHGNQSFQGVPVPVLENWAKLET
jgi:FkbM family methyltransferase